ncbi:MAG: transglycosylase SLT domain-containing protein [Steroidobacteraceae bacterium]
MMSRVHFLAAVLALTFACTAAAKDALDDVRDEFRSAYDLALQGSATGATDSERLRAYPLYPYLQAARIQQQFDAPGAVTPEADAQAATFLGQTADEPIARRLRRAWLTSLADRQRWADFMTEYRAEAANSTLRCHFLAAHIALDRTTDLAPQIVERWLTSQQLPTACESVFQWAREHQVITAELVEERARLVLNEGNARFARMLAAQLPPQRAEPLQLWADLLEKPRATIDRLLAEPQLPVEMKALRAGWARLARTDIDGAVARYDSIVTVRKLDASAASQFALPVATGLAWNRRPEALDFFQRVQPVDLDDTSLEWYARASLWNDDWMRVRQAISAMSPAQRQQAGWQYWTARAAEQAGDRELAASLYESVLTADNFYSAMAAARLERKITPHQQTLALDKAEVERIEQQPSFARARELKLHGLNTEAQEEWQYGYRALSSESKRQAIHVAVRWGWFDQAIATASDNKVFYDYELLYPLPYDDEVKAAAKVSSLDPDIVYSVLRQESLYRADAVSSVGARGLLQLMPSTARIAAKKWKLRAPTEHDLFSPATNVRLGALHLRDLLDRFDSQLAVALAGYNAGPNAAARWLPSTPIDADRWIENIPFNETRGYVRRILWHSVVFGWLRKQKPQDASHWLAQIADPAVRSRVAEGEGE